MKKAILFLSVFLLFSVNIKAESICDNAEYQCISCKYEATNVNVNQNITFYAKSEGTGVITLKYTTTSNGFIDWHVETKTSPFNNNDNLECPDVYMKHIVGQQEQIKVSFSNDGTYEKSTLLEFNSNNLLFFKSNLTEEDKPIVCDNVKMYLFGSGVTGDSVTKANYRELDETATISMLKDGTNKVLELPGSYKATDKWFENIKNGDIDNCSSLIVSCYETQEGSYGKTVYTCSANTNKALEDRVLVDSQGIKQTTQKTYNTGDTTVTVTDYRDDFSTNCIDFSPAMKIVGVILLITKIVLPLIIIVIAIINMMGVITSGKLEEFNKTIKKTAISVGAAVLIFFAPSIIDALTNLVTNIVNQPNEYNDIKNCQECLFHPLSENCSKFVEASKEKKFGNTTTINISPSTTSTVSTTSKTTKASGRGGGGGSSRNTLYAPYKNNFLDTLKNRRGLWIAHQKNTIDKINDAVNKGFYGIEVDVIYKNGEFILYHANTINNGAKLADFLDIAKKNNVLAVLDLKTINNKYSELVSLVKKHYSMEYVVFMTFEDSKLKGLYNVDSSARLWLINGHSTEAPYNQFDKSVMTDDLIDILEGVAVMAQIVDEDLITWCHDNLLTIEAFSYLDYMYDNISANQLREWGVDYISAGEIDE